MSQVKIKRAEIESVEITLEGLEVQALFNLLTEYVNAHRKNDACTILEALYLKLEDAGLRADNRHFKVTLN